MRLELRLLYVRVAKVGDDGGLDLVSHVLIVGEEPAMQAKSVVHGFCAENIALTRPSSESPPCQLQTVVSDIPQGILVEIDDGPGVGDLPGRAHDALQRADATPVPHVLDIEPSKCVEHFSNTRVPVFVQKHPHCRIQLLLHKFLILWITQIDFSAELNCTVNQ